MKTNNEIHNMISDLMDYRGETKLSKERDEEICSAIDALLWVIGDRSGAPIDVEYWKNKPIKEPKTTIYIDVDGGMAQNVYATNRNIDYDIIVCDYDNKMDGDEEAIENCNKLEKARGNNKVIRVW